MRNLLMALVLLLSAFTFGGTAQAQAGSNSNSGPVTSVTTNSAGKATSFVVRKSANESIVINCGTPNASTTSELLRSRDDWQAADGDPSKTKLSTFVTWTNSGNQKSLGQLIVRVKN